MKQILCFMLSCILLVSLTACSSSDHGRPAESVISSAMPEENRQASTDELQDTAEEFQRQADEQPQTEPAVPAAEPASKEQTAQPPLPKQPEPTLSEIVESTAPPAAEAKMPITSEPASADDSMVNVQITAGDKTFSAKLYNNQAAQAFMELLPLTITMDELNGNEKFYYLLDSLPTDSYKPAKLNAGDLMLYGSDCLVLFYESFSTSYSYTRLGIIEDVSGLSGALGSGSVQVTFMLK